MSNFISKVIIIHLVPTVGLEPTQLTPLPPQDSVSTNFTTSASLQAPGLQEESLAEQPRILARIARRSQGFCRAGWAYFDGIAGVPEAAAAGICAPVAGLDAVSAGTATSSALVPLDGRAMLPELAL